MILWSQQVSEPTYALPSMNYSLLSTTNLWLLHFTK